MYVCLSVRLSVCYKKFVKSQIIKHAPIITDYFCCKTTGHWLLRPQFISLISLCGARIILDGFNSIAAVLNISGCQVIISHDIGQDGQACLPRGILSLYWVVRFYRNTWNANALLTHRVIFGLNASSDMLGKDTLVWPTLSSNSKRLFSVKQCLGPMDYLINLNNIYSITFW